MTSTSTHTFALGDNFDSAEADAWNNPAEGSSGNVDDWGDSAGIYLRVLTSP